MTGEKACSRATATPVTDAIKLERRYRTELPHGATTLLWWCEWNAVGKSFARRNGCAFASTTGVWWLRWWLR